MKYPLLIESPYPRNSLLFDDEMSFPDVTIHINGVERSFGLHRGLLASASQTFAALFRGQPCLYGSYDDKKRSLLWSVDTGNNETYQNTLVKWLHFCYGENQSLEYDECPASLALLNQLQLTCKNNTQRLIFDHMIAIARKDADAGALLLRSCGQDYQECHDDCTGHIDLELAKIVFSRENLMNHRKSVIDECLLNMAAMYLDYVDYGDEQSEFSEFKIRLSYVNCHLKTLNDSEIREILRKCLKSPEQNGKEEKKQSIAGEAKCQTVSTDGRSTLYNDVMKDVSKVIEIWQQGVTAGDSDAIYNLALCYEKGFGVSQDKNKAFQMYHQSSEMGNAKATFRHALCYFNGEGIPQDKKKAIELFQLASDLGIKEAVPFLGNSSGGEELSQDKTKTADESEPEENHGEECSQENHDAETSQPSADVTNASVVLNIALECYNGEKLSQDKKKAAELFQRAVDMGSKDAVYYLAECFWKGEGVSQDKGKAFELYQIAGENGNADALFKVALCYDEGDGVSQDKKKSYELYQRASDMGSSNAMVNLAMWLRHCERQQEMVKLLQRAADMGNAEAMFRLGMCYRSGQGVSPNHKKACELFQLASEKGNTDAMFELGVFYGKGIVLPQDKLKGLELFQIAADKGNARAAYRLGLSYERGEGGLRKNSKKAKKMFDTALNSRDGEALHNIAVGIIREFPRRGFDLLDTAGLLGNTESLLLLALKFQTGDGVQRNMAKAISFYKRAADLCDPEALVAMATFHKEGFGGVKKDKKKAFELYHQAAELGSSDALREVGVCYMYGDCVTKDMKKACDYFARAVDVSNPKAMNALGCCYMIGEGVAKDKSKARDLFQRAASMGCMEAMDNLHSFRFDED